MRTFLNIMTVVTIILSLGLLLTVSYWELYPYRPLVITTPLTVSPKKVKAGDNLKMSFSYCKYMDLPSVISQRFVDSLVYARPTFITNNPTGCHTLVVSIPVPSGLSSETYIIEQTVTYQVNPLRKVEVVSKSEPFTITE